ncbi:MAG: sigma-70 family RNA polymerase sigma factor [Bacillota bacterium]
MDILEYKKQAGEYNNLNKSDQIELAKKAQEGDKEAKDKLIKSCMSMAISIAQKYNVNNNLEDLIQQGYLGLVKAIDKFDSDRNVKFSTYASFWIKHSIIRYRDTKIKIPENMFEELNKYNAVKNELKDRHNKEITPKLISENSDLSYDKCLLIEQTFSEIVSYDYIIELAGDVISKDNKTHFDYVRQRELFDKLTKEIKKLPELQKKIIYKYYGIDTEQKNLQEIAEELDKSHQYISLILDGAKQYLKEQLKEA